MTIRTYLGNGRRLLALTLAASLATGSIFAYAHGSKDETAHHEAGIR